MAPKVTLTYAIKNVTFGPGTSNGEACWDTTNDLVSGETIIWVFGHPQVTRTGVSILCLTLTSS